MTEQMLEHLVAFDVKMMAKLNSLASWIDSHQAKTEAKHDELKAMMKASEEVEALMDTEIDQMKGCLRATEAEVKSGLEEIKAVE
jgi:hypothetical protein